MHESTDPAASEPSVADVLAFEALPDDVQALVKRIYGDLSFTVRADVDALVKAYFAGFHDAVDRIERPLPRLADAENYARDALGLEPRVQGPRR